MRLAGFVAVLLALPALAQSSASYGTRIGQVQAVYLEDIPGTAGIILGGLARFGEVPDSARLKGSAPLIRAEFETWALHRSRERQPLVMTNGRHAGCAANCGRATGFSTIGKWISAEAKPRPMAIHHIRS